MTSSLVGSEMCIRDRCGRQGCGVAWCRLLQEGAGGRRLSCCLPATSQRCCLLYTSDAADDM
eukprot:7983295-Prorocentrum_lima.AAC.1